MEKLSSLLVDFSYLH